MADNLDATKDQYEALVIQQIEAEQELEKLERQIKALETQQQESAQ